MNPQAAMQGRRFLFKEVGGRRGLLFWGALYAFLAFGGTCSYWANDWRFTRPKPKTYITQEDYYRSLAKSYQRRLREPWMIEAGEHYDFLVASMRERLIEIQETGGRF